ncbi:MAG: ABC transporter substrate-binding protein [Xanthobacteraceae bacterium]
MKLIMRSTIRVAAALFALAFIAANDPLAAQGAGGGGTLTMAIETDTATLDPLGISSINDRQVAIILYDTLLDIDAKGNIIPGVAEKIEASPDAMSFKLTLRRGVTFNDGTPYDAAAVVKNFQRIMDPKNRCRCASDVATVDKVEASGPLQVTIAMKSPSAHFPASLADVAGMVVSPAAVEKYGAEFGNHGGGAGAFKLKEWRRGDRIVLERNPNYWRNKVALDEVVLRPMPDQQTRYTSLIAGNIDVIMNASPRDVLEAQKQKSAQVLNRATSRTLFIQFNMKAPDVSDVRVRQALAYATDRETYNKAINRGLYKIANTPFGSGLAPHEQVDNYPAFDLAKARKLVADYGKPIRIKLVISSAPSSVLAGQAFQQMWKKAGIEAELVPTEAAQAIRNAFARDYQAMLFRWAGGTDPDKNVYQFFHSQGAVNLVQFSDPEMDKLLEAGRATTDKAERLKIYRQVNNILARQVPYLFLTYFENIWLVSNKVKGLPAVPDGLMRPYAARKDK